MENIWNLEISITLFLQSLGEWLTGIMQFFTFLGKAEFFSLIMPVFYWCLDATLGLRIGAILLINTGLVDFLKMAFHFPRPYWYDNRVKALSTEATFGMPSSHASSAVSVWGLPAANFKRKWVTAICVFFIFFIGLSRIYLGVHFAGQVLAGWLIGGLTLYLFLKLEKPILSWLKTLDLLQSIITVIATTLLIMLPTIITNLIFSNWTAPADWVNNALAANPEEPFAPFSLSGTMTIGGTWLGVWLGFTFFYHRRGMFRADGSLVQRLIRLVIGMVGIVIILYGLDAIFPDTENLIGFILRFVRYSLAGLWITGLAPTIFQKLKIAK
jgi:membrane-associated phospholipid phosphatase